MKRSAGIIRAIGASIFRHETMRLYTSVTALAVLFRVGVFQFHQRAFGCSARRRAIRSIAALDRLRSFRLRASICSARESVTGGKPRTALGMAAAFVKTFKRDYVYINRLESAETVMRTLADWFEDYNDHHPHKGLRMRSPRDFRRLTANC